jgi:TRAP-type mannitol/chloroaromatic compound transport system permease small subunit
MKEKIKIICFILTTISLIIIVVIYGWSVHKQSPKECETNSATLDYIEWLEKELILYKNMYQERLEKCPITNEELIE